MRNPNVKILVIALVLVAVVAAAGMILKPQTQTPAENVQGWLRIQVDDRVMEPVPLVDGGEYVIDQPDGKQNVVHTTASGAVMHFSTCDNQSCVQQGEVTLDNRDSRVLGNMIICLPHKVSLALYSAEEIAPQNGGAP